VKIIKKFTLPLVLSGFLYAPLSAVQTDPVGYVTFTVQDDADLLVGVPLTQAPLFSGSSETVTGSVVGVAGTVPNLSSAATFLLVTDVTSNVYGQWFQVTSATSSTITLTDDVQAAGLETGKSFKVVPFWTLDSLFPNGGDIPQSSDPFNPSATLIVNDLEATGINPAIDASYVYYDGTLGGDAGWYNADDFGLGLVGSTILSPETYVTIRNRSGAAASIIFNGTVPTSEIASNVISSSSERQDNLVANPFPSGFTLVDSNLVSSGAFAASSDPFSPTDILFVYAETTGIRPGPSKSFIYYDGSLGGDAGWYDSNNFGLGLQNTYTVPAGAAIVLRKAVGSDISVAWSPQLPYTL